MSAFSYSLLASFVLVAVADYYGDSFEDFSYGGYDSGPGPVQLNYLYRNLQSHSPGYNQGSRGSSYSKYNQGTSGGTYPKYDQGTSGGTYPKYNQGTSGATYPQDINVAFAAASGPLAKATAETGAAATGSSSDAAPAATGGSETADAARPAEKVEAVEEANAIVSDAGTPTDTTTAEPTTTESTAAETTTTESTTTEAAKAQAAKVEATTTEATTTEAVTTTTAATTTADPGTATDTTPTPEADVEESDSEVEVGETQLTVKIDGTTFYVLSLSDNCKTPSRITITLKQGPNSSITATGCLAE